MRQIGQCAFVLVVLRLIHVTLLGGGADNSVIEQAVVARADLTDRNGELLARDLPVKDLYARPHVFWDKAQAAHDFLALATGADEHRLLQGFDNTKHPYVLVARRITPDAEAKKVDPSGSAGIGIRTQRQALLSRRTLGGAGAGRHRSRQ